MSPYSGCILQYGFICRVCLQNAEPEVGDLLNLETSFTENTSLSHPATTLTFESECGPAAAAALATGHRHRPSIDTSGGLSERLLAGKPTEYPGKPLEFPTVQLASRSQNVMPTGQHSLVILFCRLSHNDRVLIILS